MSTVPAPIKAADTIQKMLFEKCSAASKQERLQFKKYLLKFSLHVFPPGTNFKIKVKVTLTTIILNKPINIIKY